MPVFFIFKHLWAPNRSWKIFHGVLDCPEFFVIKRVGTLLVIQTSSTIFDFTVVMSVIYTQSSVSSSCGWLMLCCGVHCQVLCPTTTASWPNVIIHTCAEITRQGNTFTDYYIYFFTGELSSNEPCWTTATHCSVLWVTELPTRGKWLLTSCNNDEFLPLFLCYTYIWLTMSGRCTYYRVAQKTWECASNEASVW